MILFTRLAVMLMIPLLLAPFAAGAEEKRESCRVCGMWIDEYKRSSATLNYKDGTHEHTCGVACMLREIQDAGGISAFRSVMVHDWVSGKEVPAESAYYVVGSDVIPDMLPNYIAFASRAEAEAFAAKEKGEVLDFDEALGDSSPRGNTAPFRMRTAVTGGKGSFSAGLVYGYMEKDRLKIGSNSASPGGFIQSNAAQPKAPKSIEVHQQSVNFNYSLTDDLSVFVNAPWFEKRVKTYSRNTAGVVGTGISDENGLGDVAIETRYNLWRSTRFDKWFTVLLGTTLPTGHFDSQRSPTKDKVYGINTITSAPGLQLGTGSATFNSGLLYSQRFHNFWLHTAAQYRVNPENDNKYKFGDVATFATGLHYTPNYDVVLGVEMDANHAYKNEDMGRKIGNTGGTQLNLAFIFDWRFLNAGGGNFNLRGSVGLPIYEDFNYKPALNPMHKPFTQVQLGDGFFGNLSVTWNTRFSPFE